MNTAISERIKTKDVLVIAIPMILATISIPFLGLVDTIIAGHLGNADLLSAVEVGDTIFGFIYMLFSFLRLAVTGFTAQAIGRESKEDLFVIIIQGLAMSLGLGIILALTPNKLLVTILDFVSTDYNIQQLTFSYLNIRLLSVPAALGNLVISAFLLGMKHAKFSMYLLLLINFGAMILDVVLAYYLGMGINGLAYAVLIGQYIGFLFGIFLILNILNARLLDVSFNLLTYLKQKFSRFLHINNNLLIRSICFITVYSTFLVTSARLGTLILAANSVLLAFYSFISLGLEGFANATEVLVGTAVGKSNSELFLQSIVVSVRCAFLSALGITLVYFLGGRYIINFVTDIPAVRQLSNECLIWVSILPMICVWCYLLDAVFLGLMRVKVMRNSLIVATFVFFIPTWLMTESLGNNGLWLSLVCFFIGRIIVLIIDLILRPISLLSSAQSVSNRV